MARRNDKGQAVEFANREAIAEAATSDVGGIENFPMSLVRREMSDDRQAVVMAQSLGGAMAEGVEGMNEPANESSGFGSDEMSESTEGSGELEQIEEQLDDVRRGRTVREDGSTDPGLLLAETETVTAESKETKADVTTSNHLRRNPLTDEARGEWKQSELLRLLFPSKRLGIRATDPSVNRQIGSGELWGPDMSRVSRKELLACSFILSDTVCGASFEPIWLAKLEHDGSRARWNGKGPLREIGNYIVQEGNVEEGKGYEIVAGSCAKCLAVYIQALRLENASKRKAYEVAKKAGQNPPEPQYTTLPQSYRQAAAYVNRKNEELEEKAKLERQEAKRAREEKVSHARSDLREGFFPFAQLKKSK
ncbi:MAG: hypothetical protein Q7S28_04490 [bacterium]|nr:hypothetical protein [bacterium]